MPAMTPQAAAQGFGQRLQAVTSAARLYLTNEFRGQKNAAVRFDKITYGFSLLPPFANSIAGARLIIYQGLRETAESSGSLLAGLSAFTDTVAAFMPGTIYFDQILLPGDGQIDFPRPLMCEFEKDVCALLLAPHAIGDTIGAPSSIITTVNFFGGYTPKASQTSGKLITGV